MVYFAKQARSFLKLAAGASLLLAGCSLPNPPNDGFGGLVRDPQRNFQQPIMSWQALKEENVVMQKRDFSCGASALATVCRYFWGDNVGEDTFLNVLPDIMNVEDLKDRIENGLTMTDLRLLAVKKGYLASLGKRNLADLPQLKIPVIVRIKKDDYQHFVVLRGVVGDRVFLADPIRGNLRLSIEEFGDQWRDRVLLVVVKPNTKPPQDSPLFIEYHEPVQPELQAARRSLYLNQQTSRVKYY